MRSYIVPTKTNLMLKSKTLITYPVHAVLLYFSLGLREWLIHNGYSVVSLLVVGNVEFRGCIFKDAVTLIKGFILGSTVEVESFVLPN